MALRDRIRRAPVSVRRIAAVALALAALVALAHTSPVRALVLARALRALEADGRLAIRVRALDYNLLAGRIELAGLEVATPRTVAQPFLTASRVIVLMPWSVVLGPMRIDAVTADGLRLAIVRDANGKSNLPSGAASADEPAAVFLGRASIRGAAVAYTDLANDVAVDLPAVDVDLRPQGSAARGTLAATRPGAVRVGAMGTRIDTLAARLAWDGRTITIDDATLVAPEGRLALDGTIGALTRVTTTALAVRGTIGLAAASPWLGVTPSMTGDVTMDARVDGTLEAPTARVSLDTRNGAWRTLGDVAARVVVTASLDQVTLDRAAIDLARGHADVTGHVDLRGREPQVDAAVTLSGIDVAILSSLASDEPLTIRPAARADGLVRLSGSLADVRRLEAAADLVWREGPAARGLVPTGGAVRATLGDGRWHAEARGRAAALVVQAEAAGEVGPAPTGTGRAAHAFAGHAQIDAASLAEVARALTRAGLASTAADVDGRAAVTVRARGALDDPALGGTVRMAGLRVSNVGPMVLAGDVRGTLDTLRLDSTFVELGPNRLDATGTVAPRRGALDVRLTGAVPDPARLAPGLPEDVRPSGTFSLDAHVAGPWGAPRVTASVDGREVAGAGQAFDHLAIAARLVGSTVCVDRLEATQPTGRLTANGTYDLRRDRYRVALEAHDLAVAPLPPRLLAVPIEGHLEARFVGEGSLGDPTGEGIIATRGLRRGEERLGDVTGTMSVANRIATVDIAAPVWQARVHGTVATAAPHAVDLSAALADTDLARLLRLVPGAPAAIRGTASATLRATGDADRRDSMAMSATLGALDARVGEVPVRVAEPARAEYAAGSLRVDGLRGAIGESRIEAAGRFGRDADPGLRLSVDARAEDLVALAKALGVAPPDITASGPVGLDAQIGGTTDRMTITGTARVADARVHAGTLPELRLATLDAAFDPSRLTVASLAAAWQEATLTGSASLPLALMAEWLPEVLKPEKLGRLEADAPSGSPRPPDERAHLELRATGIGRDVLGPFLAEAGLARLGGAVSASASFDADALALGRVTGHVQLDDLAVSVADLPIRQEGATRIDVAGGFARVGRWTWAGDAMTLRLDGQVRLADLSSALIATGAVDLRVLTPFVADTGIVTGGRLEPRLVITGPLDDATIDGVLTLTGGELAVPDPELVATDVSARAVLSRNRLDLVALSGTLNGGRANGRGAITLQDFVPVDGRLAITGRGLALDIPRGLQSEADTDLTLAYGPGGLAIGGSVRVLRGAYREPLALATGLLASFQAPAVGRATTAPPSLTDQAALDIVVATDEDLRVDNNYGRFDLGADLRVVGTVAEPALAGRVTVREGGQVLFGGRTYTVEQPGFIDFANPFRIEPNLDVTATTRVARCSITLTLKGTPDTIKPDLASPDCDLGQADIVSLLLTGRRTDELGGIQAQVAGEQLLGYLSGEVLGKAGRALGLDRLEFGQAAQPTYSFDPSLIAGDADPTSRLTFGKTLARDLDVAFSQSLRQSGGLTWVIGYRPVRQVETRLVSNDDGSRSYEFRHDVPFGAPRVGARRAPGARGAPPRVASVTIAGVDERARRVLEGRLSLATGKRFDFQVWRRDRERLASVLAGRGYREARVTPGRTDTGAGVALDYAIDRGPETRLDVQGTQLDGRVTAELFDQWARGVFDSFRATAIGRVVRAALLDEGYLDPAVQVTFERRGDPAVKTAHVVVTPGTRVRQRDVRIAGVAEDERHALERWLRDERLVDAAFTDPPTVASALTAHLRDRGFMAAVVTAAPPIVEGTRGTVVIQVDPGAAFHVSSLVVEAARPGPESVPADAALREGGLYTPAALAAMRATIVGRWRRAGFAAVKVGVETAIDASRAAVAVVFRVESGPRQVLDAVVVSGVTATRPALVTRTLDLPLRQPVGLDTVFQARKRLAETGIFRRVDVTLEPAGAATVGGDEPVRARVTAEEWPRYRLQYGFRGLDREENGIGAGRTLTPGLAADVTRRNLFGAGMTAGASLRVQARQREARAFWAAPSLVGLPITSTLFVSRGRQEAAPDAGGFVTDESKATVEQRLRLPRQVRVLYSYNLATQHLTAPIFDLDTRQRIARLNASGIIDTRDNPEDAHRGWFHASTVEYAAARIGSQLAFAKYTGQLYHFRAAGPVVLASAARLGLGGGLEGQVLIGLERFFAGGGRTVRGYAEDSLGPRVRGVAAGGNALLLLNGEARFPIHRWVRGVGFVDAGNVFATIGDVSFADLETSAGLGLRIQTPVVLLRIDYGVPLPGGVSHRGRWIFSIGQAF